MSEVVGIRFKEVGKIYYFDPIGFNLNKGDRVIVETVRGLECGEVAQANKDVNDDEIIKPLKPIVRVATAEDLKVVERNKKKEGGSHGKNGKKGCDNYKIAEDDKK